MVTQQLRDYVAQQTKLGVLKDAIKSSLLSVGWNDADVSEVLSSPAGAPAIAAFAAKAPATTGAPGMQAGTGTPGTAAGSPAGITRDIAQPKMPEKMPEKSPTISFGAMKPAPSSALSASPVSSPSLSSSPAASQPVSPASQNKANSFFATKIQPVAQVSANVSAGPAAQGMVSVAGAAPAGTKGGHSLPLIIMGAVTALSLGAAGFLFWKGSNNSNAQVTALTSENASLSGQVAALTGKVADQTTKANTLEADNKTLTAELGIFQTAGVGSSGDVAVTVRGTLAGGDKTQYSITTSHGIVVYVKNWKDSKADAALKPLVGKIIEIVGTHVPGYRDVTVASVNGAALAAPATGVVATSTAH